MNFKLFINSSSYSFPNKDGLTAHCIIVLAFRIGIPTTDFSGKQGNVIKKTSSSAGNGVEIIEQMQNAAGN